MTLFTELKRRNVFRVGIAYVVTAWLILQVADIVLDNTPAPDWVMQVIMLLMAIGFPLALLFAWAFELINSRHPRLATLHFRDVISNRFQTSLPYTADAASVATAMYINWLEYFSSFYPLKTEVIFLDTAMSSG